jgi:hypothetical protein
VADTANAAGNLVEQAAVQSAEPELAESQDVADLIRQCAACAEFVGGTVLGGVLAGPGALALGPVLADLGPPVLGSLMLAGPTATNLTVDAATTSVLETPLATTISVGPATAAAPPAEAALAQFLGEVARGTEAMLDTLEDFLGGK